MEDYSDLEESIAYWRDVLQLNHWRISVPPDVFSKEETTAEMCVQPYSNHAIIIFAPDFFSLPEEDQEKTVLHELIHVYTRHVLDVVQEQAQNLSQDTQFALKQAVLREMEICTAGLTDVIYDLEKLVPEQEEKEVKDMACKKKGKGKK